MNTFGEELLWFVKKMQIVIRQISEAENHFSTRNFGFNCGWAFSVSLFSLYSFSGLHDFRLIHYSPPLRWLETKINRNIFSEKNLKINIFGEFTQPIDSRIL